MALQFQQPNFDPNERKKKDRQALMNTVQGIPSLMFQYQELKRKREIEDREYARDYGTGEGAPEGGQETDEQRMRRIGLAGYNAETNRMNSQRSPNTKNERPFTLNKDGKAVDVFTGELITNREPGVDYQYVSNAYDKSYMGTQIGKPPSGYRWAEGGGLEPIPGGPVDNKKSTDEGKKDNAFALYETARDGLMEGLSGTKTGYFVGKIPAMTAKQQKAEGGVAAMAPVLKQLFRVAGEGVFTDRDQALLLEMVPTRKDEAEAAQWKIENIDAIVKAKLGIQKLQKPTNTVAPQPAAASSALKEDVPVISSDDDYNALPSGSSFVGPDGKLRRKP